MTLYSFNLLQFLAILFFIIFIFWYFLLSFRSYTYNLLSSEPILYFLFYFIAVLFFFFLFWTLLSYHWKVSFLELLLYYCNFFSEKFLQYFSSKLVSFFSFFLFFFAIFFFRNFNPAFLIAATPCSRNYPLTLHFHFFIFSR